ncbi:MFS transporter [Puniceicoccus vermicola]|uniref:MFS transporter n=1 Tax=Puniceicoccus vermicola TaxID=388746 RepID=A0A7X1E495_9BACT|nr:MFS transporter [Puniceicoccus vermicola]MBC2600382.1 MFS transporter [Puniceicoccus vermicola]
MKIDGVRRLSPRFPFDPARVPFFYGWIVAAVGTLSMIATVPATPPGFAPFVDPMMGELSVSRAALTFSFTVGTIGAGLLIPFAGFWIDRMGVRIAATFSFLCLGLAMALLSEPLFYTGILERIGLSHRHASIFFLFVVFFSLRFWGLGMIMTTCRSMIFRWFVRWRSLIAGLNGMILSLSFSSAPVLLEGLVILYGWKGTWWILAGGVGVGFAVISVFFFRDSPEACGIPVRRGEEEGDLDPESTGPGPILHRDYTAFEAARTPAFWLMASGLAMNAFIGTGTAFHMVSVGAEMGDLPRDDALHILLYVGIFNVLTSLTLGFVAEKIRLRYLLFFMMACQTVSSLGLLNFRSDLGFWAFALGSGCAWGTFGILVNVPWPRFFGRKHLGSINGIVTGVVVVFSALGPYAFGLSYEITGSYQSTVFGCLCLTPLLALLGLLARNPRRLSPINHS